MGRRTGVSIQTQNYGKFKGVDFSTDASLVDSYRSPLSVNMIADTGGMPEKRIGWRTLHRLDGAVNGLFHAVLAGEGRFFAHAGTKLYGWKGAEKPAVLLEGLCNGRSQAASMGGKLWILTGGDFLVCDSTGAKRVSGGAYVPTTTIAADPKTGGGERLEYPNLLTGKRKMTFIPDGVQTVYQLDAKTIDADAVTATVWGEAKVETTDFTVDREKGTVSFKAAPAKPVVGAEGGVEIAFSKTTAENLRKVQNCRILTTYGVGSATGNRLVISGNPEWPNLDWTSGLDKPDYIPENSFAVVGTESTAIMGYRRIGEYLAILKQENGQDSAIFLRSAGFDAGGKAIFPVKQSIAGVGAVALGGFGSLLDEQLFLSGTGVYAITTNALTAERIVQNRSFFVDNRLCREPGLEKAACVSWGGMFLVGVNHHVYLLDGRQDKSYRAKSQGDYVYECYYWEGVPAACFCNHKDGAREHLYFGTDDGRICRFNDDLDTMERYADDGAAIRAVWSTKADDDGDVTILKFLIKKGNSVTIKPYTRSSAQVYFRTEQDPVEWLAREDTLDIFDWEDLDFSRFTFDANDAPREILFNTKVKKYKRLQILVKNEQLNEGFGIYGITKHFVAGNFAKR